MMTGQPPIEMPYIVSAVFYNPLSGHLQHTMTMLDAGDKDIAAGRVVSNYYLEGGKLPLFNVQALPIPEEIARRVVLKFDEKLKLAAEEAAKVVHLVPTEPDPAT